MPAQAMTQQATRHARRVYVGGLPPMANEQVSSHFVLLVLVTNPVAGVVRSSFCMQCNEVGMIWLLRFVLI
jgi:hypothetical protein